jgi:hypothetical protein
VNRCAGHVLSNCGNEEIALNIDMDIICKICNTSKPKSEFYTRQSGPTKGRLVHRSCKECAKQRQRIIDNTNYAQRRQAVLKYYSGGDVKCACCGEKHQEFLTIDHVDGNGAQHRREIGENLYRWLVLNNFPPGFRVLCSNCNTALGIYGVCPHQSEANRAP